MKLASFTTGGRASWGVVEEDGVLDAGPAFGSQYATLRDALSSPSLTAELAALPKGPKLALDVVQWLPAIPNPAKIICIGLNYETHRQETGRAPSSYPSIFTRFADSQVAHAAPILMPRVSKALDYEGELAVVIGQGGRYIEPKDAMRHVAGYACYNDATLRDWQRHTTQFIPGKNFPQTGGFGPWMVTADEITDIGALRLTTRLNGTVMQDAGLDQLIFPIPELIAYCSSFTPLHPGDVIATGTPGGVGFKREPPVYMKAGDVVEVEVSGVGLLRNTVVEEAV
jgi:2-keto-4-pentenoate hydratase/2-oxohepta-3-ene-1,7-dioic acid hydratase in catechol pathway